MIVKILGTLDILSAALLWITHLSQIIPKQIMLLAVFYLMIKGVMFLSLGNWISLLDILSGLVIYLSLVYSLPGFIIFIVAVFLIQKGIISWIS
jgi:nitrogen fixation/metabolism regulation signal transduction histidine kinase